MKSRIYIWVCLAFLAVHGTGCGGKEAGGSQPVYQPGELVPAEVSQYEGEKLSSWQEFSENSIKGPQQVDAGNYFLVVAGLVNEMKSFSYRELVETDKFDKYKKVVTLNCVEGWSVKILWEGIRVRDLLDAAGINSRANTVVFYGYDGYSTFLSLSHVMTNDILIAYKMNGITLPAERGFPFQLVAEQKWGYKWIKWVTRIELSDTDKDKGYWEKYGYSPNGDLSKYFFDR